MHIARRKANNDDRSPRIDALGARKEVRDHSTSKSTALLKTCSVRLEVMLCAPLGHKVSEDAVPTRPLVAERTRTAAREKLGLVQDK